MLRNRSVIAYFSAAGITSFIVGIEHLIFVGSFGCFPHQAPAILCLKGRTNYNHTYTNTKYEIIRKYDLVSNRLAEPFIMLCKSDTFKTIVITHEILLSFTAYEHLDVCMYVHT